MSRTQSYIDQYTAERSSAGVQNVTPSIPARHSPMPSSSPSSPPPRRKGGGLKYIVIFLVIVGVAYMLIEPMDIAFFNANRENLYATTANGYSMEPTIKCGDIVVVERKDAPGFSLATGDILVFLYILDDSVEEYDDLVDKSQYCVVGHTITNIENGIYYTQGDGNSQPDPPVEQWQIVGKIVDHIPRYNHLKAWLVSWIL